MGRSFAKVDASPPAVGFFHEASGRYYSIVERAGARRKVLRMGMDEPHGQRVRPGSLRDAETVRVADQDIADALVYVAGDRGINRR